jgi:glycosyltransferase involved in cell wall biosynthesis
LHPGEYRCQEQSGSEIHYLGLYRQWDITLPVTLSYLEALHQKKAYTAVWGHYLFPAGFIAVWFAECQGIQSIISARGNDVDRGLFPPGDFSRLAWTVERADVVTTVSQDLAQKLQVLTHRQDIRVLSNAVDADLFAPTQPPMERVSLGIQPDEVVLGFSGELREKKGQAYLLEALRTVRAQRPACLLIIGEVRSSQDGSLQVFAAQYPEDAQRLIITGHLSDPIAVARHLRTCDLYLQPSLWEGMPNALLEAMATELCCLASDAGGIAEVITHGKTGFLLPRTQLHHLGTAILECLDLDPDLRQTVAQAARQYVLKQHTYAQEKERLEAISFLLKPHS